MLAPAMATEEMQPVAWSCFHLTLDSVAASPQHPLPYGATIASRAHAACFAAMSCAPQPITLPASPGGGIGGD